jgi:UDPglucose--hexose-1-phosphate uridylyltransferase
VDLMRELRTDPTTGDQVILATERVARPRHLAPGRILDTDVANCPFCPGNEAHTPPTIAAGERDGGWNVRVFPNRWPALGIEGALERHAHGPYAMTTGIGAHEVIVESDQHDVQPWIEPDGLVGPMTMARARMRDLQRDGRFRSLLWFRNAGPEAGATLGHPHAQLIASPEIPPIVRRMTRRARAHWDRNERELLQDLVEADVHDGRRVLFEEGKVLAVCPWAPRVGFEVWLVPTVHAPSYPSADDPLVRDLARAMGRVLRAFDAVLDHPPHNAVLYTAPAHGPTTGFRWHVRLLPRMTPLAGFELGGGAYLHGVPPELAASELRGA